MEKQSNDNASITNIDNLIQKEIEKTPARQTKTQPLDLKKSACYVNKDSAPRPASEHGCHLA